MMFKNYTANPYFDAVITANGNGYGMARRKARRKRTRQKKTFNLSNGAQGLIIAGAFTQAAFNNSLAGFFMDSDTAGSFNLNMREVFSGLTGGSAHGIRGGQSTVADVVATNLKANWMQLVGVSIITPVVFKVTRGLLAKSVINPANRVLKSVNVPVRM